MDQNGESKGLSAQSDPARLKAEAYLWKVESKLMEDPLWITELKLNMTVSQPYLQFGKHRLELANEFLWGCINEIVKLGKGGKEVEIRKECLQIKYNEKEQFSKNLFEEGKVDKALQIIIKAKLVNAAIIKSCRELTSPESEQEAEEFVKQTIEQVVKQYTTTLEDTKTKLDENNKDKKRTSKTQSENSSSLYKIVGGLVALSLAVSGIYNAIAGNTYAGGNQLQIGSGNQLQIGSGNQLQIGSGNQPRIGSGRSTSGGQPYADVNIQNDIGYTTAPAEPSVAVEANGEWFLDKDQVQQQTMAEILKSISKQSQAETLKDVQNMLDQALGNEDPNFKPGSQDDASPALNPEAARTKKEFKDALDAVERQLIEQQKQENQQKINKAQETKKGELLKDMFRILGEGAANPLDSAQTSK